MKFTERYETGFVTGFLAFVLAAVFLGMAFCAGRDFEESLQKKVGHCDASR